MIESFEPVLGNNPKILILGSMPSVKSLEVNEYYGHPRNQFWSILFKIITNDLIENHVQISHSIKTATAIKNNIAIWDVLSSCEREGSLDSDIKNETPNDIGKLLEENPSIKAIIFNGGKAESTFKKFFKTLYMSDRLVFIKMPSTSPAYTMKFEKKLEAWQKIKAYIGL